MPSELFSPAMLSLILGVLFAAAFALATAVGIILSYHWFRYAMNPVVPLVAIVVYGLGCFVMLSTMFSITLSLSIQ